MQHLLLASAAAAALAMAPLAQAADAVDGARLTEHIKVLSSDAFEGRGPATPGEEKTVAYLIAQMKAAGLQPGGDLKGGTRAWTQDVPLARFTTDGPVQASITAGGQTTQLVQGEQIAIRAAQTGAQRLIVAGAPVVFVGYGVKAPERGWDDYKGVDLKGKVALVLVNDPDFEGGEGDFGGKAMTYYGRWTYKFEEAARQGAVGFLVIHETAPASYGWPTVKNSNTAEIFDIIRQNPAQAHAPLEGWIQRDVAVEMFTKAGLDFEALRTQARTKAFRPVDLTGVTFATDYRINAQRVVSKNVVGLLPGARRPDERVIYTAHWDHLGVGLADASGDRIYNGAVDNATGTALLVEMGRAFARAPRTDRSVMFLAVTAEEKGLLGSEYYAANPLYPLGKTVAILNMDGLRAAGPARDFTSSGNAPVTLQDDLIAAGLKYGRTYSPDPRPEAGAFYRSDHFPFAKRGVPAISFGAGQDLVTGGKAAGRAWAEAYNTDRYHQPSDEFDPSWQASGIVADANLLFDLGHTLANGAVWPEWKAGAEFKAERDKTAGERR